MSIIERPTTTPGVLRRRLGGLAAIVATPLVTSDYLDLIDPLRSAVDLRGRIVEIAPETADAATIVIKPGRGWRSHIPGQYVRIGVDVDGVRRWRAYSITSPVSRPDGCITITVKAIPNGLVSNFLVHRAQPGLVLQLDQATGEFTLPPSAPAKVLLITAGSGITPVMGMLRNAINDLDDVVLLHSAPTSDDVIFAAELRQYAADGRLRLVERHTDTAGMLSLADLADAVPDLIERETWACGPVGLLDLIESRWELGDVARPLHIERFRPAITVVGEGGTVSFTNSDVSVDADGASPLLEVGEAAGLLMPSGCRMGICFGCVLPLRQGAVRDLRTGDVTSASEGDGALVQTCISAAAGDCAIDL